MAVAGRRARLRPGWLAGARRRESIQRLSLHGERHERVPVRIVHPAAGQFCGRPRERRGRPRQFDVAALVRCEGLRPAVAWTAGHRRTQHAHRPGIRARRLLAHQAVSNWPHADGIPG